MSWCAADRLLSYFARPGGNTISPRTTPEIALSHHERWDGSGYPEGRIGERIPLTARIVALADTLDALSSTRVYRPAWPMEKVLAEIEQQRGAQFDPQLAALCRHRGVHQHLIALGRVDPHSDLQRLLRE
jgi:response regulator RpfG family c-di-GMP phosphodiesterase